MTPPDLILRDTASPDHWTHWTGNRVLFSGADQVSVPDRARERALVQRTGQLMYELSVLRSAISGMMPEYAWDVEHSRTIDGVPYYGPHRNYLTTISRSAAAAAGWASRSPGGGTHLLRHHHPVSPTRLMTVFLRPDSE